LARWRNSDQGTVLPENFIARLENLGLIDELCWRAAELALSEARSFVGRSGVLPRVSINVSMHSLHQLEFPDAMMNLARKYNFPTEAIAIEITESRLMSEISHNLDVLTRLRMKNFQLSIDDFGTGYAMMRQLQNVPATELKIDKSIIQTMHVNDSDRVMVEKIIEMGHELKMEVIAEGVVVQEQYDMLRAKGCDGAQGYLFSKPLPVAELVKWIGAYEAGRVR
jgi:EAL domain-containing protein (putative c-di-GMP-specific phosphodiesterase class I)